MYIKLLSPTAVTVITGLINHCFSESTVPKIWKKARIRPLYKSGIKSLPSNYRPISVLPEISKIMERLVFNKLFDYLIDNSLLSDCQFGFRPKHSCTDAQLSILKTVHSSLSVNKKVCLVTLDIQKAFDSVNHSLLLNKLQNIGCDQQSIDCFTSYLTNRTQFVKIGNKISNLLEVKIGVPQGSVLGSLLFCLFINDLMHTIIDGTLYLYADDSSLICSADTYEELENIVNTSLNSINNWMKNNGLALNYKKSNYFIVNLSGRAIPSININIDGNSIQRVSNTKILGLYFDNRLVFDKHIDYICKNISKRINLFARLQYVLPKDSLNMLYKALIQPTLDYGISLYGYTYKTHYERVDKLIKRAAKLIGPSNHIKNIDVLYKRLNWFSFEERRHYFSSIFIYRCLNKIAPNICCDFFKIKESGIHTRSASNELLVAPNPKTTAFKNTIFYTGIQHYNSLNLNLRKCRDFKKFKADLKSFIIS